MELLSIRAYARHKGVDHSTVRARIKSGVLEKCLVLDRDNNRKIDIDIADKEWEENSNQKKSEGAQRAMALGIKAAPTTGKHNPPTQAELAEQKKNGGKKPPKKKKIVTKVESPFKSLTDQRTEKEHYETQLKRMKYEKERGTLLDVEEVKARVSKLTTRTKEALLNIPDAYGPELLACNNLIELQNQLKLAINRALEKLEDKKS